MSISKCTIKGMFNIPRWRGKYFNLRQITIGGGLNLHRITIAQKCDARDDDSSTEANSIKINYTCRMNAQLKKAAPIILIAILAVLLFVVRQCKHQSTSKSQSTVTNKAAKKDEGTVNRDKGFDRRISYLEYSKHAKCRMECRRISQAEVEEIMQDGKINYNKSDLQNARCPRYALEGNTVDNQKVRIIFAQCNDKTEVVTVIDLDTEWSCDCPGDDKKYDNKN